jgi:hypothetical protein
VKITVPAPQGRIIIICDEFEKFDHFITWMLNYSTPKSW